MLKQISLQGTTSAGGAATIYSGDSTTVDGAEATPVGLLYDVTWIDGTLADGVDAVLSVTNRPANAADKTLLTLTNANDDAMYYPREYGDDNTGTEVTSMSEFPVVDSLLKLVISSGGAIASGGCIVTILVA